MLIDHRPRNTLDLEGALGAPRNPRQAESLGQLGAQLRLEDAIGGAAMDVERVLVEAQPAPLSVGEVGDDAVDVVLRIARPRRVMAIGRCDQPLPPHPPRATSTHTGVDGVVLEVAKRRPHPLVDRPLHLTTDLGVADRPEHRHALGRRELRIPPRPRRQRLLPPIRPPPPPIRNPPAQPLTAAGIALLKQRRKLTMLNLTRKAQPTGEIAHPPPRPHVALPARALAVMPTRDITLIAPRPHRR